MTWYYSPDGSQRLEASEESLAALAREGVLTGDMLLWREGQEGWRPAREVRPDLFPAAPDQPPPPPPVAAGEVAPVSPWGQAAPRGDFPTYAQVAPRRPNDPSALTSVISGSVGMLSLLVGFCCCFSIFIAPIAGLVAVIFGHMVYGKAKGHPEAQSDANLALIGMILGYLTLVITVGYLLYVVLVVGIAGMGAMTEGMKGGFSPP